MQVLANPRIQISELYHAFINQYYNITYSIYTCIIQQSYGTQVSLPYLLLIDNQNYELPCSGCKKKSFLKNVKYILQLQYVRR